MKLIRRVRNSLRQIGTRSLIIALVVLFFTAGLATYIGIRLSNKEKEVLMAQGELNAMEAAMEYNRCLLTRVNIVTLVGKTVDDMLASGTDNETVKAYLTEQTDNIVATLDASTTGLYGWINREYLDGAGWVPDEGFVPTERPWYTETIASNKEITFVEPYLDLQTKTVMMTVSDLLVDGESVLAMDVSLEPIQEIISKVASDADGSQAFVLDVSGIVVAHSDETQLGRNYLDEPEGIGHAVAEQSMRGGKMQFDLKAPEGNYSVYVDKLEGGWYSVSLINADIWYRPLHQAMILFCLVVALVVIFLVFVFLRMSAKNIALRKLHRRINQEERRGRELQALSETDRMTGLYDRVNGERRVNELLSDGGTGMFVELDIDHFKSINDTCGHQTGDQVILAVAESIRGTFRTNDIMMRLGGDEFSVFAVGVVNQDLGEALIHRLFSQLGSRSVSAIPGKTIHISVGAVIYSGEQETAFDRLYAAADSAMYRSKKTEGNSLTFNS